MPTLAALYQSVVQPDGGVTESVAGVALWQTVTSPKLVGAAGFAYTTGSVAVLLLTGNKEQLGVTSVLEISVMVIN